MVAIAVQEGTSRQRLRFDGSALACALTATLLALCLLLGDFDATEVRMSSQPHGQSLENLKSS